MMVKLDQTKILALLLTENWPHQPWNVVEVNLALGVTIIPLTPKQLWEVQRNVNPAWNVLRLKFNIGIKAYVVGCGGTRCRRGGKYHTRKIHYGEEYGRVRVDGTDAGNAKLSMRFVVRIIR